jgi:hypothetical protein
MRVGVTATQQGLTERQKTLVRARLIALGCGELHHGDCIGGDADIHEIALDLGIQVIIHPPRNESKRAFCEGAIEVKPAYDYLVRNRHIVQDTEHLIGCPHSRKEVLRSGTWSTIRYACNTGKSFDIYGSTDA